jgi:hypothetical protein
VLQIKEEVRKVFAIGKHSIHISDTREEALRVGRILFNRNSVHFLNYGKPNKFPDSIEKINRFKDFLAVNDMAVDSTLVDSGLVLSLYGLRRSMDIDYLATDANIVSPDDSIEDHGTELGYHGHSVNELIFNNRFYFYYEDLKFVAFDQIYLMKENRGEAKDVNDLTMMSALIENNSIKNYLGLLRQKIYYANAKLKLQLIRVLRLTGLHRLARLVYRFVTRKQDR